MPTTYYCTVSDVSDFLRVPITATTTPNKTQVENIINRKEEELDRRLGHTFGRNKQIKTEVHSLPLHYNYGWGIPIYLKHRNCRPLNSDLGDKIEIWKGSSSEWENIMGNSSWYDFEETLGRLFLRGFLFSILRDYRVRVTYRYGDETVPLDIKDSCIKLVAIDLLNASFRMDIILTGASGIDIATSKAEWRADIENCIDNRQEIFFIP